MSEIFQPRVAQLNSAVTPEAGVADTSMVSLFSDVGETALKVGQSIQGKSALKGLGKELGGALESRGVDTESLSGFASGMERLSQAIVTGKNAGMEKIKARNAVDKFKADYPWLKEQADLIYNNTIGPGSSSAGEGAGSPFDLTPIEEEAIQLQKDTASMMATYPHFSAEQAQERVIVNRQQVEAAARFKEQRVISEEAYKPYISSSLSGYTVSMMDTVAALKVEHGGALPEGVWQNSINTIKRKAALFMAKISKGVELEDGTFKPPSSTVIESAQKSVDDWIAKTEVYIKDQSETTRVTQLNLNASAMEQQLVHANYDIVSFIKQKEGETALKAYYDWAQTEEGTLQAWLKLTNPRLARTLGQVESLKPQLNRTYREMLGTEEIKAEVPTAVGGVPIPYAMSQENAELAGAILNSEEVSPTLILPVFKAIGENPKARENFTEVISEDPDAAKLFTGERYENFTVEDEAGAAKVLDAGLVGLRKSFNTFAFTNRGDFTRPEFEVVRRGGGLVGTTRTVVRGANLSSDVVGVINNTYQVFASNPKALATFVANNKLPPETTPEQATRAALLGVEAVQVEGDVGERKLTSTESIMQSIANVADLPAEVLTNIGASITEYMGGVEAKAESRKKAGPVKVDVRGRPTDSKVRTTSRTERAAKAIPHGSGAGREPDAEEAKVAVQQAMEVSAEPIDETVGFTEDDLAVMIKSERITEDDAALFRARGLVDKQPVEVTPEMMEQAEKEFDQGELIILNYITKGATREGAIKEIERIGFAGDFTIRWTDAINKVFDFAEGK